MARTSAFTILRDFFEGLGIQFDDEIRGVIRQAMEDGYGPDQLDLIMPDLEQTKAFKRRFPGFHQRVDNGYNAISLQDYLDLENNYHRVMQEAGLPAGFYDDPSDFANWISNNVSVDEVQTRVSLATQAAQQVDPRMREIMGQFYGLGTGDIAAYFLDQKRALPVIERQYKAAGIAAAASKAGFHVNNMWRYEDYADKGITAEQAAQSYGTIRQLRDTVGRAASIYGERYGQWDAEQDVFFNNNEKRRRIMAQEQATFSGRSAGSSGSAQRTTGY